MIIKGIKISLIYEILSFLNTLDCKIINIRILTKSSLDRHCVYECFLDEGNITNLITYSNI